MIINLTIFDFKQHLGVVPSFSKEQLHSQTFFFEKKVHLNSIDNTERNSS